MSRRSFRPSLCRLLLAVLIQLALGPLPAVASGSADRFEELVNGFAEAALQGDDGQPATLRRWQGPIKLRLAGDRAPDHRRVVLDQLRRMASIAGVAVEVLSADGGPAENLKIVFEGGSGYQVNGRDAGCYTRTRFDRRGALLHVEVRINTRHAGRNGACAAHELMHAMGFPGHPTQLRSVLNPVHGIVAATEEDAVLLKLLYAPELELGQPAATTLQQVRNLLVRQLGFAAPPSAVRE